MILEAQKEYIITEEMRREIIDRLSKPFSKEVRKEIERIKQMHIELLPVEISRIYNFHAKNDVVMDMIRDAIEHQKDHQILQLAEVLVGLVIIIILVIK